MRMRCLAPILAAICCAGCVSSIDPSSAIRSRRAIADKSFEKAGVVCSPTLLGHVERASPSTPAGFATTYEIELGEALCNALVSSAEGSYRTVQRATTPHKGQYDRVIEFDLARSSLSIAPHERGSSRVAYTVSVVVERYGRDLQPLGRTVAHGNSLVDCTQVTDRVVREAVEAALQQVADDASSLLVARLEGPRQRGASPEPVPATPER
jgi:hypothetical protein